MLKFLATTSLALMTLQAGTAVAAPQCTAAVSCTWILGVPVFCTAKIKCATQ